MFNDSNKQTKTKKINEHNQKARNYENDKELLFKKSEKRAWITASIFGFFCILSWVGLFLILPLKEVTPYVIRVDSATGIPDIITAIDEETLTADESLDRYFVNHYIQNRESYTYQTIQKTYEQTQLFSSPLVSKAYIESYNKADSLDNLLGKGTATVQVISITLENIKNEKIATARIKVNYFDKKLQSYTKHYSIRLSYEYNPQTKLELSYRIDNPVGFFVTSYQKIEENL
ncbi:type IV secretion system protein [Pasteurella atlantica]|uniref:virB8 family protein n=1 Tax=Phocoenobacter atlanticus TaxID=3416742 RepID=UPI0027675850|nr:type IV secretion system protein [Pasteurella atlantica]MDP8042532.1 type IV secretion system protein [Pasteurella atlantica]